MSCKQDVTGAVVFLAAPETTAAPIRYPLGAYPLMEADGSAKWLASTFVIDHAEPAFRRAS